MPTPKVTVIDYGQQQIEVGSPTYVRLLEQEKITTEFPSTREVDVERTEDNAHLFDEVEDGADGDGLESRSKAELVGMAEELDVAHTGTKAELIEAIRAAGEPESETL
jgi:hypothetical protein